MTPEYKKIVNLQIDCCRLDITTLFNIKNAYVYNMKTYEDEMAQLEKKRDAFLALLKDSEELEKERKSPLIQEYQRWHSEQVEEIKALKQELDRIKNISVGEWAKIMREKVTIRMGFIFRPWQDTKKFALAIKGKIGAGG